MIPSDLIPAGHAMPLMFLLVGLAAAAVMALPALLDCWVRSLDGEGDDLARAIERERWTETLRGNPPPHDDEEGT